VKGIRIVDVPIIINSRDRRQPGSDRFFLRSSSSGLPELFHLTLFDFIWNSGPRFRTSRFRKPMLVSNSAMRHYDKAGASAVPKVCQNPIISCHWS